MAPSFCVSPLAAASHKWMIPLFAPALRSCSFSHVSGHTWIVQDGCLLGWITIWLLQAQVSYLTNYTVQLRTNVVSSYRDLMADPALRSVHRVQGKHIAHLILINNRRSGPKQMSTQYDTEKTFCGKAMPNFWESGHCHH